MDIMEEFKKQRDSKNISVSATPSTPEKQKTHSKKAERLQAIGQPNIESVLFKNSKRLNNEKFLLIYHKKSIKSLRKEFPGIAMYSPLEMRELLKNDNGSDEYTKFLRKIHFIKKTFGGWINVNKGIITKKNLPSLAE
jgi:hypothetical protein